ncbi:MAG: hypothetical protein ACRDH8_14790 [Actinomycetota bacterium]
MAREFWSEALDVRTRVAEEPRARRGRDQRRKVRRVLTRRPERRPA